MIVPLLLVATALSAGNAEFDRKAAEGAARITMERFARQLKEKGPESGALAAEMLRDSGLFASRSEAEKKCRVIFLEKAEAAFARKREEVKKSLSLDDSFKFDFSEEDKAAFDKTFPRVFAAERRDAVETQAKKLVAATRPAEAEFEEKSEQILRREMTQRVVASQKTPVFEENVSYISKKIVDPVIESAKEEMKRQKDYLMRARSDAYAPSRLGKELKERLVANVAGRAKDVPAEEAWGIFPSVLSKALPSAVERRTMNRLKAGLDEVELSVDARSVAEVIASDPGSHVRYSASEKAFSDVYGREVLSNGVARTVSPAPEKEKEEFVRYLSERLGSPDVAKAVGKVVRREIMPQWKKARALVAAEAAKSLWPTLEDGTWYPDARLADAVVSRSDYRKTLGKWREIAEMESLASAPRGKAVLEESAARADERVAAAFELARTAIAAQNKCVDSSYDSVLAEARSRKEGVFSRSPSLDDVIAMLTAATEAKWSTQRPGVLWPDGGEPSNAAEQHTQLFPSVKNKIELLARKIIEKIEVPEKEPEESQSEETTEESCDAQEENLPEFTISVVRTPDGVDVKLLKGETSVVERSVKASFAPFDKAMKEVSEKLGKDLLSLP